MTGLRLASLGEHRFTAATDLCHHPEYWTSTDDDSTECEVAELVYGLVRGLQPEFCVETGTAFGEVAEQIGNALFDNGHGRLVTLEISPERIADSHERLVFSKGREQVTVVGVDSLTWLPDTTVDFAWFDSFPVLHRRLEEFERYYPYMRKGTICCFHDTAPGHGGSNYQGTDYRSVITAQLGRRARVIHLPTPRGISIAELVCNSR